MSKWNQGIFTPKNPKKYIGKLPITYRSGWELTFMNLCDQHPNIVQWASESLQIPYVNPFTGQQTIYVPDFMIVYIDKTGKQHAELIEIKPLKETLLEQAKTKRDKAAVALNTAKWGAAKAWCQKNNVTFRVMTEEQLFRKPGRS